MYLSLAYDNMHDSMYHIKKEAAAITNAEWSKGHDQTLAYFRIMIKTTPDTQYGLTDASTDFIFEKEVMSRERQC